MKRDGYALAFALVYPSVLTWFYFVALGGDSTTRGTGQMIAYGIGKVIQFAFPAVYVFCFHRGDIRFNRPGGRGVLVGLGFGLAVAAGIFVLYYAGLRGWFVSQGIPDIVWSKFGEFQLTTPLGFLVFALFLSIAHSLLEEYYWRWFVFLRLRQLTSLRNAIAISSVGFMAHHVVVLAQYFPGTVNFLTLALPFSLCVALGGVVWAWLYERTRSFYAPWLSHLIIDAAIMGVAYDMVAAKLG